jgi:eukaryotic-like serine/threonine-protein kinase
MADKLDGITLGGRYRLERQSGGGGMSNVYEAADTRIPRKVAIKVFRFGTNKNWKREIQAIAALDHRNIVKIYDADHDNEQSVDFIAMQWLPGGALDVKKTRALPEVVSIVKQLAEALQYAHDKGIIHRDVKHGNIMIGEQGQPVLIDFSIAMGEGIDSTRTNINASLGTFTHMSPEQAQGESLTPATDQYSLGVIAYNLVTGELPFNPPAPTPMAFMYMHITAQPPVPWNVPESVSRVLLRALSKKPEERYPSIMDFANALEAAVQDPMRGAAAPIPVGTPPGGTVVGMVETPTDRGFDAVQPELYTASTVAPVITTPPPQPPATPPVGVPSLPPENPQEGRRIPAALVILGVVGVAAVALAIGVLIAILASNSNTGTPTAVASDPTLPPDLAGLATNAVRTATALAAGGVTLPDGTALAQTAVALSGTQGIAVPTLPTLPAGIDGTLTAVAGGTTIAIPDGTALAQTAVALSGTQGIAVPTLPTLPAGVDGTLTAVAGGTTIALPDPNSLALTATALSSSGTFVAPDLPTLPTLPAGVDETLTAVATLSTITVPTIATQAATLAPTDSPTIAPTPNATVAATLAATVAATAEPTTEPTTPPTIEPTAATQPATTAATVAPTQAATVAPTIEPTSTTTPEVTNTTEPTSTTTPEVTETAATVATSVATLAPTQAATDVATQPATAAATIAATDAATTEPATPTPDLTLEAVILETIGAIQTQTEAARPTLTPTPDVTNTPTDTPVPTDTPSPRPTDTPEATNTATRTNTPEATNTVTPTRTPTSTRTRTPAPTRAGTPIGGGSGKLIFKSNRDGISNIYEMNADGTDARLISPPGVDAGDPSPSPDGKLIAYVSNRSGKAQIYISERGASSETQLTGQKETDGENYSPVFTKDGKSILFVSTRNSTANRINFEIYSMNVDGTSAKRLTNNPAFDAEISILPDGKRFMFNSDRAGWLQIYIANLDGTNPQRILSGTINDAFPDISPDGRTVVFISDRSSKPGTADNRQIYTINVNGSGIRKFATAIKNPNPTMRPRWSPDGKQIAFATTLPNGNWAVFVMDADGRSAPRQITDGEFSDGDGGVRWLP